MEFRIADTFTDSLARLTGEEQKAVKTTAFDLQLNPAHPGIDWLQAILTVAKKPKTGRCLKHQAMLLIKISSLPNSTVGRRMQWDNPVTLRWSSISALPLK